MDIKLVSTFNLNSTKQLVKFIEQGLGLEVQTTTDKGNKSLNDMALNDLSKKHKFIDKLIEYRKMYKMFSGFLEPIVDYIDNDERIRGSFHNTVAKTGRLSCSAPNLQQLPKKANSQYRNIFVAPKNKVLIVGDFMGQELRGLAEVTRDKKLIESFSKNYDLHLLTANKLFDLKLKSNEFVEGTQENKNARTKYKKERHIGKNGANFPIIYGSTAWGISKNLKIEEDIAQRYIDGFFELYPGVKFCINRVKSNLIRQKFVVNKTGRRRRFVGYINNKNVRQAFNFLIQGMCADITKAAAVSVKELCDFYNDELKADAKVIMLIHDEIVVEIDKKYAKSFIVGMKKAMEQAYKIVVPLPVEISHGCKYGNLKS